MRRTLAVAALTAGLAATFVPAGPAAAAPDCDVVQNCVCLTVDGVLYDVTGYNWFHCG
jgi:hypothetical protein